MKLGFIVDGDSDKATLERLIPRLFPGGEPVRCSFVRLGGRAALSTAFTSAIVLLSKNYDHVFIVFDAGSALPEIVAGQRERVLAGVREYGLEPSVTVCPAVPAIESWLLAGLPDESPSTADPRERLGQILGHPYDGVADGPLLVDRLDLPLAERRSASFAELARALASLFTAEASVAMG